MSTRSRSVRRLATALAGGAVLGATALAAPASATPTCVTDWGSLPEAGGALAGPGGGTVDEIRTGRHDCFDRLVVDIDGGYGDDIGYRVGYVSQFVTDGRGDVVTLRGAADLQIVVLNPAYADSTATYAPVHPVEAENVAGYGTFRQVAWGGSFEGQSAIGLGVRARLPFRVMVLDGPGDDARLVIDVAHSW